MTLKGQARLRHSQSIASPQLSGGEELNVVHPPGVSQNLILASHEHMQSGSPAALSASPRATSVLHPAPVGMCMSQCSPASSEAENILDLPRPPYSLGNSQLLPPLPPQKQNHTSCTSALAGGPHGGRGLMGEVCALSYKQGEGQ